MRVRPARLPTALVSNPTTGRELSLSRGKAFRRALDSLACLASVLLLLLPPSSFPAAASSSASSPGARHAPISSAHFFPACFFPRAASPPSSCSSFSSSSSVDRYYSSSKEHRGRKFPRCLWRAGSELQLLRLSALAWLPKAPFFPKLLVGAAESPWPGLQNWGQPASRAGGSLEPLHAFGLGNKGCARDPGGSRAFCLCRPN